MATTEISKFDDVIDSRDVIARIEELESSLQERHEEGQFASEFNDWVLNSVDNSKPIYEAFGNIVGKEVQEEIEELKKLKDLQDEAEGYSNGDWSHGSTLIHDSYFTEYCKELVSDIGDMPKEIPSYIVIDWEATADNLKVDYTEVSFGGEAYFIR